MAQEKPELEVLLKASEQANAYQTLERRLTTVPGVEVHHDRTIEGWGYQQRYRVCWHPHERVAFVFKELHVDQRHHPYWIGIGLQDPKLWDGPLPSLPTQFNASNHAFAGTFAGAFLRDAAGRVHLGHTGRLRAVPAEEFIESYPGPKPPAARIERNKRKRYLLIGALDDPQLVGSLGAFAEYVLAFKTRRETGCSPTTFHPEFSGTSLVDAREPYEADYLHGRVVNALAAHLEKLGLAVQNTKQQDLLVTDQHGRPTALFEVKTSTEPYAIYTAIGQLLLHTQHLSAACKRVAVVPGLPTPSTRTALRKLGIEITSYTMSDQHPVFGSIRELLK